MCQSLDSGREGNEIRRTELFREWMLNKYGITRFTRRRGVVRAKLTENRFRECCDPRGGKCIDVQEVSRKRIHALTHTHTYLTPANDVSVHRQHVHDFSFTLVAPLRAQDHRDLRYRTAGSRGYPRFFPRRDRSTVAVRLLHPRVYNSQNIRSTAFLITPSYSPTLEV